MKNTVSTTVHRSLLLSCCVAVLCAAGVGDPDKLFRQGKQLIEANCAKCMGGTREGLETGIHKVERALDLGYRDRAEALELLAEAYSGLAYAYMDPGAPARQEMLERLRTTYRLLVEEQPENTEALYSLAVTVEDERERLEIYERILEIEPENPDAFFALGNLLRDRGDTDAGLEKMERALDLALEAQDVRRVELFGERLVWALQAEGRDREAQEVLDRVERFYEQFETSKDDR